MQHISSHSEAKGINKPKVWAVIKANAYGHGIEQAVAAFEQADGLAMLDLNEAILCRQLGWTKPILLLEGFFQAADLLVLDQYDITTSVHDDYQLDLIASSNLSKPINVFLKMNTGMNRLGFMPNDYDRAWKIANQLKSDGKINELGKMTHFARADDDFNQTRQQLDVFLQHVENYDGPISLCNTAATLDNHWDNVQTDQQQWVRPGVCLYGSSPFADRSAASFGLEPAQTLSAEIISIRELGAGEPIGYGHKFTTDKPTKMGVVSCGYADGYPRVIEEGAPITVDGVRTKVLGRVSMDMLVADLTNVPTAKIGSKVILWGEGGPSIDEVASWANTIGYELMCAVTNRVSRQII